LTSQLQKPGDTFPAKISDNTYIRFQRHILDREDLVGERTTGQVQ